MSTGTLSVSKIRQPVERESEKYSVNALSEFKDSNADGNIIGGLRLSRGIGTIHLSLLDDFSEVNSDWEKPFHVTKSSRANSSQELRSSHKPSLPFEQEHELIAERKETDEEFLLNIKCNFFSLPDEKNLSSKESFDITILKDEDSFFADNQILNISSSGSTIGEAIQDFHSQVLYFYDYYKKLDEKNVTPKAAAIKKIYEEKFFEV